MGDWLHKVLGQIGLELWFPWQQIALVSLTCKDVNASQGSDKID